MLNQWLRRVPLSHQRCRRQLAMRNQALKTQSDACVVMTAAVSHHA